MGACQKLTASQIFVMAAADIASDGMKLRWVGFAILIASLVSYVTAPNSNVAAQVQTDVKGLVEDSETPFERAKKCGSQCVTNAERCYKSCGNTMSEISECKRTCESELKKSWPSKPSIPSPSMPSLQDLIDNPSAAKRQAEQAIEESRSCEQTCSARVSTCGTCGTEFNSCTTGCGSWDWSVWPDQSIVM